MHEYVGGMRNPLYFYPHPVFHYLRVLVPAVTVEQTPGNDDSIVGYCPNLHVVFTLDTLLT